MPGASGRSRRWSARSSGERGRPSFPRSSRAARCAHFRRLRGGLSAGRVPLYSPTLRRCSSAGLERWIHNPKVGGSSPPIGTARGPRGQRARTKRENEARERSARTKRKNRANERSRTAAARCVSGGAGMPNRPRRARHPSRPRRLRAAATAAPPRSRSDAATRAARTRRAGRGASTVRGTAPAPRAGVGSPRRRTPPGSPRG